MKIVTDKTPKVDVASILTEAEIHDIHEFMHHYPQSRAASLDALKIVQRRNGWVDDAQVNAIANILKIPVTDVCDSIGCYLVGAESLGQAFERTLGISFGQTTPDNRFTLLPICCLGNCDKGPAVLIDEDTYGPVQIEEIAELLEQYA